MKMGRTEKHRAVELYRGGMSMAQVATRIGVNVKSVQKAIEEYGVVIRAEDLEKKNRPSQKWVDWFEKEWDAVRRAAGTEGSHARRI